MMGSFSKLGVKLRERKRTVGTILAFTVIAVASFFAGSWTGSSGAFTLGPMNAAHQHALDAPERPDAPKPGGKRCDMSMPMDHMHMPSEMPKRSGMPMPSEMPKPNLTP